MKAAKFALCFNLLTLVYLGRRGTSMLCNCLNLQPKTKYEHKSCVQNLMYSLYFSLVFPTAVNGQNSQFIFRVGDDATLPGKNVKNDPDNCYRLSWTFKGSGNTTAVMLFDDS